MQSLQALLGRLVPRWTLPAEPCFSPPLPPTALRKQELCGHGISPPREEKLLKLFPLKPFHAENTQICIQSLKRFTRTLKGIEIFSAGTLVIGIWGLGEGVLKTGQPVGVEKGAPSPPSLIPMSYAE